MAQPKPDNPFLSRDGDHVTITKEGYAWLEDAVTDTQGQVYVFTNKLSPVIVAAAMARLSRRAGDMRLAILDEFSHTAATGEAADALIERVVTQFGDDSVQQLIGIQFVVEGASNILTKLLEWGRFAAYLEQSTRYIFFDQRDKDGRYLYYTPANLTKPATERYEQDMIAIFELYSTMVRQITEHLRKKHPEPTDRKERAAWLNSTRATACDAVRPVLPVATKSTVGIFASSQALESLVMHLLSEPFEEAQEVGQKILAEARKVVPAFLRRTDLPERGGATTAYRATNRNRMRELAKKHLSLRSFSKPETSVRLVSHWPEQEYDLVPEMLFEAAGPLSLEEICQEVATWSASKKQEVFQGYMGTRLNRRHRPGRATEKAHFEWEIVGDYGSFRDLQRHRVVDSWEWQDLTPYLGYEVPDLVKEAGFEKEFHRCFEIAKNLYEHLYKQGYTSEAQYATLLGHRMRYRFIANLRSLFHFIELRSGPDGHPGYRKIANDMYSLLKQAYPHSAAAMQFVNQRENSELTRQAAELATQFKLEQIEQKANRKKPTKPAKG